MKLNIPNKLVEFDQVIYDPFCIFEMNNFFENHVYKDLNNNFPNEAQFEGIHQNGKKIFFNNKHENFYKFINSNIWGEFYNHLNKKQEINKLIELIRPELQKIRNRNGLKKFLFTEKASRSIQKKIYNKLLKLLNYRSIRLGFEFSIIKKNCFIPPHLDTENKLLSLMIYFPLKRNEYSSLGTNFYLKKNDAPNKFDTWESKYLDKANVTDFYNNYEIFFKSKFEENKLVGFIKNDKSWHDFSEFKSDFVRKSVNINLFIE